MKDIVRSEWIKMTSVRSTWWCLVAGSLLYVLVGFLIALNTDPSKRQLHKSWEPEAAGVPAFDPMDAMQGAVLAQFAFGVLGVLMISAEYGTGQIHTSFMAVPQRRRLMAVKLGLLVTVTTAVSLVLSTVTFFVTQAAYPDGLGIGLGEGGAWRAVLGISFYIVFITAFGFAIGAQVRGTPGAVSVFVVIVFVVMSVLPAVFPTRLQEDVFKYTFLGLAEALAKLKVNPDPTDTVAYGMLTLYLGIALFPSLIRVYRKDP